MKKKIKIFFDKNNKSILIKKILLNKIKKENFYRPNLIIVIGGDGFMLNVLKKNKDSSNVFYGINSGNYGFLMNKFSSNKTLKNLKKGKKFIISPLEMLVKRKDGQIKSAIAINEVSILRQNRQAATISIRNGAKYIIRKLVADGVMVSSPAGSTAYNLSVHGPILNLDSKKLSISPISPFRPRRWKGKVISENSVIRIKNLDLSKRPISATADNYQVKNIKEVIVKIKKKIKINLLYDANNSLQKKIKLEQSRKETSYK